MPMGMERALPVLGHQPPLPRNAALRLVQPDEEGYEQALVPMPPYYEEKPDVGYTENTQTFPMPSLSHLSEVETSYQMDQNTLMFIANGGIGRPMANQNQRLYKPSVVGPCYECGGDHLIKDCPNRRNQIPPIKRFCVDCAIKHLIQDCPANRDL